MREGRRAGEEKTRAPAAAARRTSLGGGRRRNKGTSRREPRPGGASSQRGGRAPRAGRAPGSSRPAAAPARDRTPTPLTFSHHRFEANGGHRAARVSRLLVSSRDAADPDACPGSHAPPLQPAAQPPRSGPTGAWSRRGDAGARRRPERGSDPWRAQRRGLAPAVSVIRAPLPIAPPPRSSAPPAEMRLGARRSPGWRESRALPLTSRAARTPGGRALPGRGVLKSPPPPHLNPWSQAADMLHLALSFLFLGTSRVPPAQKEVRARSLFSSPIRT